MHCVTLCTPVGRNISLGLEWWRDKVNAAGGIKTQIGTCNALSENTSMGRNGPQNGHQNGLWNARNARNGQSMSKSWPGLFFPLHVIPSHEPRQPRYLSEGGADLEKYHSERRTQQSDCQSRGAFGRSFLHKYA